ncbi:MAG: DNA-directed RNA polymerase subunit beta [Clostridia bacterium]|nr:DNA-directed RNA polymerase subunit beta [Clostridia bacterium]
MVNVTEVRNGRNTRMTFSKIHEVLEMPNLIEIQKNSYNWFLESGLREIFDDSSGIEDHTGKLLLEFIDYRINFTPKYTIEECKQRDATYSATLYVKARLLNRETGLFSEQEVYMGEFPLMTPSGTFVINGAERVIVSQLVRSPGVYYKMEHDKTGKELFYTTVIPNRGAWLEYENDVNDVFYVRIDKNRKLPITTFIRALGLSSNDDIYDYFGHDERIEQTLLKEATITKDGVKSTEEAWIEVFKKLRPGEPPSLETARNYIEDMFFDPRKYDISRVGRHKYNQKLCLGYRLVGHPLTQPIINRFTGEIVAEAGEVITKAKAEEINNCGAAFAYIQLESGKEIKVICNGMVDIREYVTGFDVYAECHIDEKVSAVVLEDILNTCETDDEIRDAIIERKNELIPKHITRDDIFATINYFNCVASGVGTLDDIDHLGNRRIRSVGELLQNQFRIGFARLEKGVREKMGINDADKVTPTTLINSRPVNAAIKEFFGTSPLSQFMDQNNPLAELTHKRRLSALGPGGLSRDRAGFEVRDVHYSHYGRMCPIETPEGPNIGLISYLATYARVNDYGFIEAPFRKVDKETGRVTDEVRYMTADVEDEFIVAQANEPLDETGHFIKPRATARCRGEFLEIEVNKIDYMDVSPKMLVSVATAMIPFLENDDANRALMGSNMQKQAVPLLRCEAPIVGTGMEYKAGVDSGNCVLAEEAGTVTYVSANEIRVKSDATGELKIYKIIKFMRSNQGNCFNQTPIVSYGEHVEKGDVIADGPSTCNGEISLGKNVLIGFMTWEGYNYEDAVLLNEKIVRDDVFTSIHIAEFETEARDTKLGPENITSDIPNVSDDALKNLDEKGIVHIGAEVHAGDILVGKVTPKGETELTAEERLLRAIFGEKAREVRDTSLKVPHGESGIVVDVQVFTKDNCDELAPGVNMVVRVYLAQKRKISVGDKMAGRHGNKGVVSRILPVEDMPFLPGGQPLDIVLNPLGVPSRMNIGQVLEVHLGMAAKALGYKVMTPVFDGAHESDIVDMFEEAGMATDGKTILYDGRTGEQFDNRVTVGYMYFLKLHHLVDDKIHARSTGPYSLVTQQPLGGKAQFGGQRFGEMEVWALEAYGAAYTLQEILTIKSDDVVGRVKTYEAIIKGQNIPKPGIPESFKVLIKELQSLGLDVKVLDADQNEIDLKQHFDEDDDFLPSEDSEQLTSGVVDETEFDEGGFMDDSEAQQQYDAEHPEEEEDSYISDYDDYDDEEETGDDDISLDDMDEIFAGSSDAAAEENEQF